MSGWSYDVAGRGRGGRVGASVRASLPVTASGRQFAREDAEAWAGEDWDQL